jgi:hypothetical protein
VLEFREWCCGVIDPLRAAGPVGGIAGFADPFGNGGFTETLSCAVGAGADACWTAGADVDGVVVAGGI